MKVLLVGGQKDGKVLELEIDAPPTVIRVPVFSYPSWADWGSTDPLKSPLSNTTMHAVDYQRVKFGVFGSIYYGYIAPDVSTIEAEARMMKWVMDEIVVNGPAENNMAHHLAKLKAQYYPPADFTDHSVMQMLLEQQRRSEPARTLSDAEAADVLEKAADILERDEWVQGTLSRTVKRRKELTDE